MAPTLGMTTPPGASRAGAPISPSPPGGLAGAPLEPPQRAPAQSAWAVCPGRGQGQEGPSSRPSTGCPWELMSL